jgi:hypothetical protein
MKKILVDGRKFGFQHFVQDGYNLCVAFHSLPFLVPSSLHGRGITDQEISVAEDLIVVAGAIWPTLVCDRELYLSSTVPSCRFFLGNIKKKRPDLAVRGAGF